MHDTDRETVLLVCGDEARATRLMADLDAARVRVVGPYHTARVALAVTAQTGATIALLASETTGQRDATQLAQSLLDTWGVRSMLLDEDAHAALEAVVWRAPDRQVARIRKALAGVRQPA